MIKVVSKKATFIATKYQNQDAWYVDTIKAYLFFSFIKQCNDDSLKKFLKNILGCEAEITDKVISSLRKAKSEKIEIRWLENK